MLDNTPLIIYTLSMLYSEQLSFKIISVHSFSWGEQLKYAYPRPYDALSFRVKGLADFSHENQTFSVKENDIIFVPKNYDYTIYSKAYEQVIVVHFLLPETLSSIQTFTPSDPEIFKSLFKQLEKVYSEHPVGYKQKLYSLFYEILEQVQIQIKSKALKMDVSKHFEKSLNYLRSNFSDPDLSVELLAQISNVSTTYYRKLFNKTFSVSPAKYINDYRLTRAKTLLKTGYYTVEQVAIDCGFNDPKYFATCYKKKFCHSPGKDVPKLFKSI